MGSSGPQTECACPTMLGAFLLCPDVRAVFPLPSCIWGSEPWGGQWIGINGSATVGPLGQLRHPSNEGSGPGHGPRGSVHWPLAV